MGNSQNRKKNKISTLSFLKGSRSAKGKNGFDQRNLENKY